MKSQTFFMVNLLVILQLVSCAAPIATNVPATVTSVLSPTATVRPTKTSEPTATPIPGFEDWSVFNPQAVEIKSEDDSVTMTLIHHALWFMQQRGVLMYKMVDGNFKITADIHTAKHSDPTQAPGGDKTVQLGGLMARSGKGGQENYVFIVVGDDGDGLSIETKSTTQGLSKFDGPAWDSADAELRLCRVGQTFNLYKRHINSDETWAQAASFDRPDLSATLQVGLNIYTDSTPDLQIEYKNIKIEPITSADACTMN